MLPQWSTFGVGKRKGKERKHIMIILLMKEVKLQSFKTLAFYSLLAYDNCPSHDEMKQLREVHSLQSLDIKRVGQSTS